jgi:hypothetical protein
VAFQVQRGQTDHRDRSLARDAFEMIEEHLERVAGGEVAPERLEGDGRAMKAALAAHSPGTLQADAVLRIIWLEQLLVLSFHC